jgi:asparagine synthase (glutamine-hydrolysing)
MCGINGVYAYHPAAEPPAERELLKTRDRMRARGPDGHGAWWTANRRCGLGHGAYRSSIYRNVPLSR